MTELREDMTKAIQNQIHQLARLRGCPQYEARAAVQQTLAENLADSRGTTMEPYWEAMVTVAGTI